MDPFAPAPRRFRPCGVGVETRRGGIPKRAVLQVRPAPHLSSIGQTREGADHVEIPETVILSAAKNPLSFTGEILRFAQNDIYGAFIRAKAANYKRHFPRRLQRGLSVVAQSRVQIVAQIFKGFETDAEAN